MSGLTDFATIALLCGLLSCAHTQKSDFVVAAPSSVRLGFETPVFVFISGNQNLSLTLQLYDGNYLFFHERASFAPGVADSFRINFSLADMNPHEKKSPCDVQMRLVVLSFTLGLRKEFSLQVDCSGASFRIFTDKPIYTPGQKVKINLAGLDYKFACHHLNFDVDVKNPDGIIIRRFSNLRQDNEIIPLTFSINAEPQLGHWTIEAHGSDKSGLNVTGSQTFEVREYVLPRFDVRFILPGFLTVSTETITVGVESKYSYGKPVSGVASLAFGVQYENIYRPLYRRSSTKFTEDLINGKADFEINVNDTIQSLPYKSFPVGGRLRVTAYVKEAETGDEEKATDNTLVFSKKTFFLDVSRNRKYFKPGLPYHLEVLVRSAIGEPIPGSKVGLKAKTVSENGGIEPVEFADRDSQQRLCDELGLTDFYVNVPRLTKELHLELKAENEEPVYLTLLPETSSLNDRYISIRRRRAKFPICFEKSGCGDVQFQVTSSHVDFLPSSLCYFVTCHGLIINKKCRNVIAWPTTIPIAISPVMQPCCYLVVFYQNDSVVVADHAPIYTQEAYPNNIAVQVEQQGHVEPGAEVTFKFTGQANSVVTLTGVDKAVQYLVKDSQRSEVNVSEANTACYGQFCQCLAVGGRTSLEMFQNSGLGITTRAMTAGSSLHVLEPLSVEEKMSNLEQCCDMGKKFCIADEKKDCDGKRKALKELGSLTDECMNAYVRCCNDAKANGECVEKEDNLRQRSLGGLATEFAPVTIFRSNFPESWQEKIFIGDDGSASKLITLPHSITTWQIRAMGTSPTGLFGVAKEASIIAFRSQFLDLILPYSVKRGEQFLVKAVVFNYNKQVQSNVAVELDSKDDSVCTSAGTGSETDRVTMDIPAESSRVALFSVVPLKVGEVSISAVLRGFFYSEKVTKSVRVEPEGIEKRIGQTYAVDPEDDKGKNVVFDFSLPRDTVKDSALGHLYITGNLLSPMAVVSHLGSLIAQPYGCGEQNLLRLSPNIAVLQYLNHTDQLTPGLKNSAIDWIQEGYERELNYRRKIPLLEKGSFSAFGDDDDHPGSTWLTAFVARTLCQARAVEGITIDSMVIDDALKWLVTKQNRVTGQFEETGRVIHQEMTGGVSSASSCSLTAFILISMLECSYGNTQVGQIVERQAFDYVTSCLRREKSCSSSFFKSLAAYTYCLGGEKQLARRTLEDLHSCASVDRNRNMLDWTSHSPTRSIATETASYTGLAYMCLGDYKTAEKIINWITSVRNPDGGFTSTQDTILAIQALSTFAEENFGRATNLIFNITAGGKVFNVNVASESANVRHQIEVPVGGNVTVVTTGKGTALVQAGLSYNSLLAEKTCNFDITVKNELKEKKDELSISLCVKHRTKTPTMMSVIEIELFSGFKASDVSLKALLDLPNLGVKRYESVGRVLKLYLEQIKNSKMCLNFKAKRFQKVGFVQPATVRVYDYYNPDDNCTRFYAPEKTSPLLDTLCFKKSCVCGAGRCPACYSYVYGKKKSSPYYVGEPATCRKKGKNTLLESNQKPDKRDITKDQLVRASCLGHFAYKVKVDKVEVLCDNGWTKITVKLLSEIKEGIRDYNFNKDVKLAIWKRGACHCPKVEVGKDYLFVGNDSPKFIIDHNSIWMPWKNYLSSYVKKLTKGGGAICEKHVKEN